MKAIAFLRTSTEQQRIEQQRKELIEYIIKDGYTSNDIIEIGVQGASARKMDNMYISMIEQIKQNIIDDSTIDCVYCWAVDRLIRKRTILYLLIDFLKAHNVNLKVMNINLSLMRDGKLSQGDDMSLSMMAAAAEWEMTNKQMRFDRTNREYAQNNKFKGGNTLKYGYRPENKYLMPDVNDDGTGTADVVRLIFALYSTGEWSTYKLALELQERGFSNMKARRVQDILSDNSYTGRAAGKNSTLDRHYLPLITPELFDKCAEIRKQQNSKADKAHKSSQYVFFGTKIVRCSECGRAMSTTYANHFYMYRCAFGYKGQAHKEYKCTNHATIMCEVMDGILWDIAKDKEAAAIITNNAESRQFMAQQIEVLKQKISAVDGVLNNIATKEMRIAEMYERGRFSIDVADKKFAEIDDERNEVFANKIQWENEIVELQQRLNSPNEITPESLKKMHNVLFDFENAKRMKEIVKKHIKKATFEHYNTNIKRMSTGFTIYVSCYDGTEYELFYFPHKNDKLYVMNSSGELVNMWNEPHIFRVDGNTYTIESYKRNVKRGKDKRIDRIIDRWNERFERICKEDDENRPSFDESIIEAQEMAYLNAQRTN